MLTEMQTHEVDAIVSSFETPWGKVFISCSENEVVEIKFAQPSFPAGENDLTRQAKKALLDYINGERTKADIPFASIGTAFQQKVWRAAREIPFGQTRTYQELAREIRSPRASRAVGSALGKNPFLLLVPCHRVLQSSGAIGGFAAGLDKKKALLDFESSWTRNRRAQSV